MRTLQKIFLAEKGYDPQYGARPLHRAIQKYLEDPLAEYILNNQSDLQEGTVLSASLSDNEVPAILISRAESNIES